MPSSGVEISFREYDSNARFTRLVKLQKKVGKYIQQVDRRYARTNSFNGMQIDTLKRNRGTSISGGWLTRYDLFLIRTNNVLTDCNANSIKCQYIINHH